jgi:hypothetical protein
MEQMTEQMMEHLVAILGEFETKMIAKMDTNREERKAEMKADQEEMLAKTDAHHVWREANHEETMAEMWEWQKERRPIEKR